MIDDEERERSRLAMPVEQAIQDEWGKGIAEQRDGDPSKPFVGDPLVQLHDQLLGAMNYLRQVGRSDERTYRILHNLSAEKCLFDALWAARSAYQFREQHAAREASFIGQAN